MTGSQQPIPEQPGWVVQHSKYGTWFMPRAAVIEDWQAYQRQEIPVGPIPAPSELELDCWWYEQISWIEISKKGTQLERPDMAAFERAWLAEMARNADTPEDSTEVEDQSR